MSSAPRPVVLVDLDGVVGQFVPAFLNCYKLAGGSVPTGFVVDRWGFADLLPDQDAVGAAWRDPRSFLEQELYPQAAEALRLLNDHSDLIVITSPAVPWEVSIPAKLRWLAVVAPWLRPEQIVFCARKEIIDGQVLIDDYTENCIRWRANHPNGHAFLIARPWNREHWERAESSFVRVFDGELIGLARVLCERRTECK